MERKRERERERERQRGREAERQRGREKKTKEKEHERERERERGNKTHQKWTNSSRVFFVNAYKAKSEELFKTFCKATAPPL